MNLRSINCSASIPDVSVLIVNYNGLRFLEECITSIESAFTRFSHEIIVVDNASQDGSQAFLQTRKDIHYIASTKNFGFTGGNNIAAKTARGRVLLLLNNDTRVEKCLDPMVEQALQEHTGVVGARLVFADGRLQCSVGYHHSPLRLILSWLGLEKKYLLPRLFRRVETNPEFYEHSYPAVDWVSGACLATRRDVWERLQGLDEAFFMYCEDVDYCCRVRKAGLNVAFSGDTLVMHYEGAGRPWIGQTALQRTGRSYGIYLAKHYRAHVVGASSFALAIVFAIRALAFSVALPAIFLPEIKRQVLVEKAKAYFVVAWQLAKQGLLGVSTNLDGTK